MQSSLAAYLFDRAVTLFGAIVESALVETVEVGPEEHKRYVPRYRLTDLLKPGFHLPRKDPDEGAWDELPAGVYDEAI